MKLSIETIASIAHNLNRDYCSSIGDQSQPFWMAAPKWQKESAIEGVKDIIEGKTKNFEEQHQSWWDWKIKEGWKHGAVKDIETKTHPCMVPYDDLPKHDKIKDELFRNIVKALLPLLEDEL